jgi:tagatose-1,6-bisphosphate aldolase non-catalytic subunit AgaZ/GatZ
LPQLYPAAAYGQGDNSARGLVLAAIGQVLMQYEEACRQ